MTRVANVNCRRTDSGLADCHTRTYPLGWQRTLQVFALLFGLICGTAEVNAQPVAPSETQLKAAFLANFPKYVQWTVETHSQTNGPIVIATWGATDLTDELRKMTRDKSINGRPVVSKVLGEDDNPAECHVLFVPDSARRRVAAILEKLKGTNVLTVGENDDFLEKGGVINLARRDRKVRLEVNLETAAQAGLKISSKLLGVAEVVKGK